MRESRTNKVLNSSFKSRNNNEGGFIGKTIKYNTTFKKSLSDETKIRKELQNCIMNLIVNKQTIEKIKKSLRKDEYKNYEQYFDIWIENWIMKINLNVKREIEKALNENKSEDEIIEEIREKNNEIYNLYEEYIKNAIRTMIEEKERLEKIEKDKEEAR